MYTIVENQDPDYFKQRIKISTNQICNKRKCDGTTLTHIQHDCIIYTHQGLAIIFLSVDIRANSFKEKLKWSKKISRMLLYIMILKMLTFLWSRMK